MGDGGKGLAGPDPTKRLLADFGIAARTTSCAHSWLQADIEARQRFGSTPTWRKDVARWLDNTRFIQSADEHLTLLHRLGKAAAHIT